MDLEIARRLAIEYGLKGPEWALDESTPIEVIRSKIKSEGGCGPGKWGDMLVPDTVYGLSMKPACYLHDCMYSEADTSEKRYEADLNLLKNGEKIIKLKSRNDFMIWIRMLRYAKYYVAVDLAGDSYTAK